MVPLKPHLPTFQQSALLGVLGLAVLLTAACPQSQTGPSPEELALAEAVKAETQEIQERLEEAAAAQQAANEASQNAIAEREALLLVREDQLREQEELRLAKSKMAEQLTALEQRERRLAALEKKLENFEANLEFQQRELSKRESALEEISAAGNLQPSGPDPGAEAPESEEVGGTETSAGTQTRAPGDSPGATEAPVTEARLEPGRLLEIEFTETVSSSTHRRGDTFSGRLVQDLTAEDGTLVVPAGTEVIGRVTEVTPLKRVGGRASIEVEFTHLEMASGETLAISASFVEIGADKRKDKRKIAGAAIVGAILGKVLGGDGAESVLAGAAVGAAAGTAAVARAEGKDAVLPAGQIVALQLEEVVTVEIEMAGPVEG